MKFKPLIDIRSITIIRAFVLNAIVLAIIATMSIELRNKLDNIVITKGLSENNKIFLTMLGTFIIGIIVYFLIRILFGFGDGLMATSLSKDFI